jgi:4-hydroxythreonine-4-phosphate dehydrogenase
MRASIVIVADELTGAADCGVACTAAGLSTVVVLNDAARARDLDTEAIAFDADTRHQSSEQASAVTERAVRQLSSGDAMQVLYKKIDSTRGNFAIEIAAARKAVSRPPLSRRGRNQVALAQPLAIVAPAFPAAGRTTIGGRMFVQGIPLEETEVWRNEGIGGVADLPALLEEKAGLRTASIGLKTVRSGAQAMTADFAKYAAGNIEAVVCDAETEEHLRMIAQAAAQLAHPAFFAGSAGLARYLPEAFGLTQNIESHSSREQIQFANNELDQPMPDSTSSVHLASSPNRKLLFAVGSMSQISREQFRRLENEPSVSLFAISPGTLLAGPDSGRWRDTRNSIEKAMGLGNDIGVTVDLNRGINLNESTFLSDSLAQLVTPLVQEFAGLFCTGGETARALLDTTGAVGIRLIGEIEPGIPLGIAEGGPRLAIVTKAGGFGTAETLLNCRAALHRFLNQRTQL